MRNYVLWLAGIFCIFCFAGFLWLINFDKSFDETIPASSDSSIAQQKIPFPSPKRIIFVNSYHQGYPWSDGILNSFIKALDLKPQQGTNLWESAGFLLAIIYLDTKRNATEKSKLTAAVQAKKYIEHWRPDIVVTSDDNAVKYIVVPLVQETSLPFVFTGVNWSAAEYDLPANRGTGMIEVQPVDQIVAALKFYGQIEQEEIVQRSEVCFLKGDDLSAVKEADAFERFLGISIRRHLVSDFDEWHSAYMELQQECEVLLVGNAASIRGWDSVRAKEYIGTETLIPTGTWDAWMREYVLLTFSTVPAEHGEWAANAVRSILSGQSPADIPVTQNHKAKIYRNMAIAKDLDIIFPMEFMRRSMAVLQDNPK